MQIHIVTEMDERPDSVQSGPLSAHADPERAATAALAFNEPLRGNHHEAGHYAQVVPVELDLHGLMLTTADTPDLTNVELQTIDTTLRVVLARRTGRS
jgi:hypothetical protein